MRTDYHALRRILILSAAIGKFVRWRIRLMEFHFRVRRRAGVKHHAAEALSRLSTKGTDNKDADGEIPVLTIQQQFCNEKHKLHCGCQVWNDKLVNFEPH